MAVLWLGLLALALAASVFVIWPLFRNRGAAAGQTVQRGQVNVVLYREHLAEIDASRERGDIDEKQYQQLKLELDRALLEDSDPTSIEPDAKAAGNKRSSKKSTKDAAQVPQAGLRGKGYLIACALCVPLMAFVYYQHFGAGEDWAILQLEAEKYRHDMEAMKEKRAPDPAPARALIAKLESRLASHPENLQNWYLLARTSLDVQNYPGAVRAYKQILNMDPTSTRVMGELAQALYLAAGNKMTPEIETLIDRTLSVDPNNRSILGLAGINAFESGNYQAAIDYWQRILDHMGPMEPGAASLRDGIARATQQLAAAGGGSDADGASASADSPAVAATAQKGAAPDPSKTAAEGGAPQVTVNISLGEEVPTDAEQVVFVYARAWKGPKMPLAIARLRAGDLPRKVVLDESMAMAPGMTLSQFPEIEVVARLSQSGQPTPQPGDWQATQGPLLVAELSGELALVIDRKIE